LAKEAWKRRGERAGPGNRPDFTACDHIETYPPVVPCTPNQLCDLLPGREVAAGCEERQLLECVDVHLHQSLPVDVYLGITTLPECCGKGVPGSAATAPRNRAPPAAVNTE